jgi:hypothetical protein
VCYCEPQAGGWHVTWCGHAVCIDCLQQYASSQVKDQEHTGPLKCPVCPQELRKGDAIVALKGNDELIQEWDLKIRNQLLRALPAYRSCPKCSNNNKNTNTNTNNGSNDQSSSSSSSVLLGGGGGGFVTPECLQPHYDERREVATRLLKGRGFLIGILCFMYIILVSIISKTPSKSPSVDLFFMLVPIFIFIKAAMAAQYWLATIARKNFFRPITVECPCCNEAFVLPAESRHLDDEETKRWIGANTRHCPSCSAPIVKTGGCNHMRW